MRKFISSQLGSLMVLLIIGFSYICTSFVHLFTAARVTLRAVRGPIFIDEETMSLRDRLISGGVYGLLAITLPMWAIVSVFNVNRQSEYSFIIGLTLTAWLVRKNLPGIRRLTTSGIASLSDDPDGTGLDRVQTNPKSGFAYWPISVLKCQLSMFVGFAVATCGAYLMFGETWPASRAAALELAHTALVPAMSQLIWSLLTLLCMLKLCLWMIRLITNSDRTRLVRVPA